MFPLSLRVRVDGPLLLGPRKKNSIYFVELFPDDGLSGGSGVCVSPPERSLWLPPTDCAEAGAEFIAITAAARNTDMICFRLIILSFLMLSVWARFPHVKRLAVPPFTCESRPDV